MHNGVMADISKKLRARLKGRKQKELAADLGVSEPFLSMVLKGHKAPGPKILKALGLRQVVTVRYERAP